MYLAPSVIEDTVTTITSTTITTVALYILSEVFVVYILLCLFNRIMLIFIVYNSIITLYTKDTLLR